jgi:hypothetical protein
LSWGRFPMPSTFDRARRREGYRRLARLVGAEGSRPLLPLEEVRRRLRLFEQTYVGIRPIPVDRVVGTAGRTEDFDRNFLPLRPEIRQRWERVERAYPEGAFPPIVVFQLGDAYFVVDGHHRVAIARQRGMDMIDAEVTLLRSRFAIPPEADIGLIILAEQERLFLEESGLDRARPEARIEFSRADGYPELLELVKVHGYHVMLDRRSVAAPEEMAADWYDRVYLPTVEAIREERLSEAFPRATEADLFLWLHQRRRGLFPERGSMPVEDAVREIREEKLSRPAVKAKRAVKKLAPAASAPQRLAATFRPRSGEDET